jgi:hypothetical protein
MLSQIIPNLHVRISYGPYPHLAPIAPANDKPEEQSRVADEFAIQCTDERGRETGPLHRVRGEMTISELWEELIEHRK